MDPRILIRTLVQRCAADSQILGRGIVDEHSAAR
jgi:hypothetical protein